MPKRFGSSTFPHLPSPPRNSLIVLIALIVLIVCGLLPASASAQKFTVDNLLDPGVGSCTLETCSLRAAITASNAADGPDEIEFSAQGTITLAGEPFPAISEDDLTISAPTPNGIPSVALEGAALGEVEGEVNGLEVLGEGRADISGLAIGGFEDNGIALNSDDNTICASHIGTDQSGEFLKPNGTGIHVADGSVENRIGYSCQEDGNLISGNEFFGVADQGDLTLIGANLVGTDVSGLSPRPNGGGGVLIDTLASQSQIVPSLDETPNTIAYNEGPGVLVAGTESYAVIVGNSIFSNDGLGIQYVGEEFNAPPTLESATVSNGQLTIKGALGVPGSQALDFYANEECDPSGFGEGQTPLGFGQFGGEGPGTPFEVTLEAPIPSGQTVITATTTTGGELSATGPFSACVEADGIPDIPDPPGPPAPQPPAPQPLVLAPPPAPVNTQSVVVETVSGKVLVKVPGSKKFQDLSELTSIPIGSIVDATKGKVRLRSVNAAGVEQSADFYEGMFKIIRQDRNGLVTLRLVGGDFSSCNKGAGGSRALASKGAGRRLWGSGKGKFRTEGNFGAAVIRGTIWLTKDQCKGTFFKVRQGTVAVTDFVLDKTFSLPARKKGYWAKKTP